MIVDTNIVRLFFPYARIVCLAFLLVAFAASASAQIRSESPTFFRMGERLSYNVSFAKYPNMAFFETFVVSRGKIGGRDAIEIQGRAKTFELVSALFSLIDENRKVFVSLETGFPLLLKRTVNSGVLPKETTTSFLNAPTTNNDLLTLVFKAREAGGRGTFAFSENGEAYVATFLGAPGEKVKTDAGDFETTIASTVQSTYLDGLDIKNFRINFSDDEFKIPVLIRFKTGKGDFVATLSGMSVEEIATVTESTPTPVQTPLPTSTPKPQPWLVSHRSSRRHANRVRH